MTRVAAGQPGIWPDVCADNARGHHRGARRLSERPAEIREMVADGRPGGAPPVLEQASAARRDLAAQAEPCPRRLAELRVPVPDREGVLAEITALAGERAVNIDDIEIAHSPRADGGVLVLVVRPSRRRGAARRHRVHGTEPRSGPSP